MSAEAREQKVVLFLPINSAGHLNASVAVADRLRDDHDYRCIFLLVGSPPSRVVVNHGHEQLQLEEINPLEDYEVEDDEDTSEPVDVEEKQRQGKSAHLFDGCKRWTQVTTRYRHLFAASPFESFKAVAYLMARFVAPHTIANNENIAREIERLQPALIVCDTLLPPPKVLKDEHKCPWVRLQTSNPINLVRPKPGSDVTAIAPTCRLYTKQERQRLRAEEPETWRAMVEQWRQMSCEMGEAFTASLADMRTFYRAHNCEPDRLGEGAFSISSNYLNLYMFPKALDYDQDDDLVEYPARWLRCDSLMRKSAGDLEMAELKYWSQLLDERLQQRPQTQVIFFSMGSMASGNLKLMKKYLDMLASDEHEDRLYVVSKGVYGNKYELEERNMIGADYIPQPFFLQRAHLAIIHGGNNSVTECLYYGLPTIVLPNFFDQHDNGQRIEDLGLGKTFNVHDCTRAQLLGAIDDLLQDQALRQRLRAIGAEMQARDELAKVSEVLSDLVENKRLSEHLARKHNIRLE